MAFDVFKAIRFTPYYARETDWPRQFDKVSGVLGFGNRYPTAKEFVTAVHQWQSGRVHLTKDGILGATTWKAMAPVVQSFKGAVPAGTGLPDWFTAIESPPAAAPPQATSPLRGPGSNLPEKYDDQLLKEMVEISLKMKEDPYTAYPISYKHLADESRNTLTVMETTGLITPTLRVGQLWPGLKGGTRLILALNAYGPKGGGGTVVFMTESGRLYKQAFRGWSSDYQASVWANVNESLAPILTMLEAEAKFLMGAISALHPGAAAFMIYMNTLQYIAVNKKPLGEIIDVMPHVIIGLAFVRAYAPTLFDKVFLAAARKTLTSIPQSAVNDPKIIAFLVGQLVVNLGRLVLLRDVSPLVGIVRSVVKRIAVALGHNAYTVVIPVGVAAGKAVPAAMKEGAMQLVKDLAAYNVTLAESDAVTILIEVSRNREQLNRVLYLLGEDLAKLVAALEKLQSP